MFIGRKVITTTLDTNKTIVKMDKLAQSQQSWSDHSDLGWTKNLFIYGQSLVFSEFCLDQ